LPEAPVGLADAALQDMNLVMDDVLPFHVTCVFPEFFSDDAPSGAAAFHQYQGNITDLVASPWVDEAAWNEEGDKTASSASHARIGAGSSIVTPGGGTSCQPTDSLGHGCTSALVRSTSYVMHLKPGFMLPKSTRVEKTCRAQRYRGGILVVEHQARSLDVPFGDLFATVDRWVVEPSTDGLQTRVRVGVTVRFSSFTMFRSQILS